MRSLRPIQRAKSPTHATVAFSLLCDWYSSASRNNGKILTLPPSQLGTELQLLDGMDSARAALELATCRSVKSFEDVCEACARLRAAVAVLQRQPASASQASATLFKQCLDKCTQLLKGSVAGSAATVLHALAECLQHCPQDVLLQAAVDLAPELLAMVKRGDVMSTAAACICYKVFTERLLQCLAVPATRSVAAQCLAKAVAAAVYLIGEQQSADKQCQGFALKTAVAGCMPQALRSQTAAVSSACLRAVSPPANAATALPLQRRIDAAHALACVGACTATSEGWAMHMHGLLRAVHLALALLPMPPRDSDLHQAAQDVLGGSVGQTWAAFVPPAADAGLDRIFTTVTLLLHCVACMLSERMQVAAPLPMAALVLLVSRLLSLRTARAMQPLSDPVQACQWSACTGPLINAGVLALLACACCGPPLPAPAC